MPKHIRALPKLINVETPVLIRSELAVEPRLDAATAYIIPLNKNNIKIKEKNIIGLSL